MFKTPEIPTDGWSMLLNRLPTGGTIYLNGKMVADLPLDSERRHVRWRRPHLINLPVSFMQDTNDVLIYTSYGVGVHGIGPIDVGPTAELQRALRQRIFRQPYAALDVAAADGAAGDRASRCCGYVVAPKILFGLLALMSAFWALRSLDLVFESMPADARFWIRGAFYLGTAVFTAVATITMWRQGGRHRARAELGLIVLAAMGPWPVSAFRRHVRYHRPARCGRRSCWRRWRTGVLTLAGHALFTPSLMLKGIVAALVLALGAAVHDLSRLHRRAALCQSRAAEHRNTGASDCARRDTDRPLRALAGRCREDQYRARDANSRARAAFEAQLRSSAGKRAA